MNTYLSYKLKVITNSHYICSIYLNIPMVQIFYIKIESFTILGYFISYLTKIKTLIL